MSDNPEESSVSEQLSAAFAHAQDRLTVWEDKLSAKSAVLDARCSRLDEWCAVSAWASSARRSFAIEPGRNDSAPALSSKCSHSLNLPFLLRVRASLFIIRAGHCYGGVSERPVHGRTLLCVSP